MALLSETYQYKKLNNMGINIKTKYLCNKNIYERNTDNSKNDDIKDGVRVKKEYYLNNKLIHNEDLFDTRIQYSFISNEEENKDYICPNCGMNGKLKDFIDGCPYCNTYYNIDYTDKDLGSKYHYDQILRDPLYRIITLIVDIIISTIICFIFLKTTSRTFNSYDISKVFIYSLILTLILYYLFYMIDAYIVIGPIKRYKDKMNKEQKEFFDNNKIDKKAFYNNVNYELRKYYYSDTNIIDFDILDYLKFNSYEKDNIKYIDTKIELRLVSYNKGKISSKIIKKVYRFKRYNDPLELKGGENIIMCRNCGASINVLDSKCKYCDSEIKYHQEWILENIN